jgi:hypothetical protein
MTDLVDYLRDKLADCCCTVTFLLGRPGVGCVQMKRWTEGCAVHRIAADLEVENDRWRGWLRSRPTPEPVRRKRWWRR